MEGGNKIYLTKKEKKNHISCFTRKRGGGGQRKRKREEEEGKEREGEGENITNTLGIITWI